MKYFITAIAVCISQAAFTQNVKVKVGNTTLNAPLPKDLTNRVFWDQTDLFKFNLDQLTGSIIYSEDTTEAFTRGPRIVNEKFPLQIKVIDKGLRYHEKVDKGFDASLKLLLFSGNIAENQVVEITITDLCYVFMEYEKIPIDSLLKVAKAISSGAKKYYIQGALLTSIEEKFHSKVSGNATLAGSVFGANGKAYKENEKFTQDFRISLTLIDLEKLKFFAGASNLNSEDEKKQFLLASTVKFAKMIKIKQENMSDK